MNKNNRKIIRFIFISFFLNIIFYIIFLNIIFKYKFKIIYIYFFRIILKNNSNYIV